MSKSDEGVGLTYRSKTLVGRGSCATQRNARAGDRAILCVVLDRNTRRAVTPDVPSIQTRSHYRPAARHDYRPSVALRSKDIFIPDSVLGSSGASSHQPFGRLAPAPRSRPYEKTQAGSGSSEY
jgi:hypothetical protein